MLPRHQQHITGGRLDGALPCPDAACQPHRIMDRRQKAVPDLATSSTIPAAWVQRRHAHSYAGWSKGHRAVIKSSRTFSVQAGSCPAPVGQSVFICTPTEGSTVASPVHITAAATAPPGRKITAMRIYIDNKAQLTVSAANITDDVPLPAGKHTLVVVAWDNTGASLTGARHFTIAGSTGPCLPSSAWRKDLHTCRGCDRLFTGEGSCWRSAYGATDDRDTRLRE